MWRKKIPGKDRMGTYHIDDSLVVADKAAIKDLTNQLAPHLRELGGSHKIFLSSLARYWVVPCCSDPGYVTKNHMAGYLPRLGDAV